MKIETHENGSTIAEAFAGTDKMERIIDKLKEIVNNNQSETKSVPIKLAIELYADTVEDAVGIAFEMKYLMKLKENDNDLKSLFDKLPKFDTTPDSIFEMLKGTELINGSKSEEPRESFDSMIYNIMKMQDCETCSINGNCPAQTLADSMTPKWREGREL